MKITVVDSPAITSKNKHYASNRAPLTPSPFVKLPLTAIKARGWLRHQLDLMVDGMVGRLHEFGQHLHEKQHGWIRETGGGWEEQPYWFRGFYTLAALTGDERCLAEAKRWIDAMCALQDPDGYFGPKKRKSITIKDGRVITDLWPQMIMLDAIIQDYEFTHDPRIPKMMTRFFQWCREIPDDAFMPNSNKNLSTLGDFTFSIQQPRGGDMLPHLFWLYNITGDKWLLDLAHRFYHKTDSQGSLLDWTDGHNVNFAQRFAYPEIYWQLTHEPHHRAFTERRYQEMMTGWGQPRSIFGGDEYVRQNKSDPKQGLETCGMTEMAKSFYLLARIDGDPRHLDRCEDIMLNHFPAANTPNMKAIHYLTASNQVQLDNTEVHDITNNGMVMLSYSPHTVYRCCQHNVAMGWPWYAANLWQATADNGLALWMYSASEVTAKVGTKGQDVTLEETTDYPFDGKVRLKLKSVAGNSATFPLYLRVPGWCGDGMTVKLNGVKLKVTSRSGAYVRIERTWKMGDKLDIAMPMTISVSRAAVTGAATVDRGPLSFSVKIGEDWKPYGTNTVWPEHEVFPTTPWNYGLVLDGKKTNIKVSKTRKVQGQPWTHDAAPIELTAKAKRIPNWGMDSNGTMLDPLQESPIVSSEPTETIHMVPLGCARLRMSALPVIGNAPAARPWVANPNPAPTAPQSDIRVGP